MLNTKNIIAALVAAVAVFGFFAFALPEYDNIVAAREMLAERQTKFAEREALVKKVAELNDKYNDNVANIEKLDSLLPTEKRQDEIVSSLQTMAAEAGLSLNELGIADVPNQGENRYKSGLVTMRAFGQYEQFYNFLLLLEQSLRLYDIQNVSISESTASGAQASRILNFEIKINVNSIK